MQSDVAVVAAYGQLLRPELLASTRCGFVNVHFSLLPRWRGASPVVRAILAGDSHTGVSIMQIDAGLDTGPVYATVETAIEDRDTGGILTGRLAGLGARLLAESLPGIIDGSLEAAPQDDERATAAAKVKTDEAFIDPVHHSAIAVVRAVRAFSPKPGAWGVVEGERTKVWEARLESDEDGEPGVAVLVGSRVILGTRRGSVALESVQPPGKARMGAGDWMRGRRGAAARFESATR